MSSNTKIQFAILATAFALAAAAPAAFAQGAGTTYRGIHTDPGGTPDAPAAIHTQAVMQKNVASFGVAPDTGTTYQGIHTDAGGTPDAPAGRHTQVVMQKTAAPSGQTSAATASFWVPNY